MDRGLYSATSGGLLQFKKLEVVANNVANVNTPGFKKQVLVSKAQSFEDTLASAVVKNDPYAKGDHARTPGTTQISTETDFSLGSIKNTGNPLDVALQNPKDFFVVNTPNGVQYTRAGNFTMDSEGNLLTADGATVQGDGGQITANGPGVNISPGGIVTANNIEVGRLQVVRFNDPKDLERVGDTRFKIKEGGSAPIPVEAELIPQSIEMSNVSVISGMIDMISANRAFDMYTKSSQSIDQLNQAAIGQVGRAR